MKIHELYYDESWRDFGISVDIRPVFSGQPEHVQCSICNGHGRYPVKDDYYSTGFLPDMEDCWYCNGIGSTEKYPNPPAIPDDLKDHMRKAFDEFFKSKEKEFQ